LQGFLGERQDLHEGVRGLLEVYGQSALTRITSLEGSFDGSDVNEPVSSSHLESPPVISCPNPVEKPPGFGSMCDLEHFIAV
jgi:hypothetical protein